MILIQERFCSISNIMLLLKTNLAMKLSKKYFPAFLLLYSSSLLHFIFFRCFSDVLMFVPRCSECAPSGISGSKCSSHSASASCYPYDTPQQCIMRGGCETDSTIGVNRRSFLICPGPLSRPLQDQEYQSLHFWDRIFMRAPVVI